MWPHFNVIAGYKAFPWIKLRAVPVCVIFNVEDLSEEVIRNCYTFPNKSAYLEYVSSSKAKFIFRRGIEFVLGKGFHCCLVLNDRKNQKEVAKWVSLSKKK